MNARALLFVAFAVAGCAQHSEIRPLPASIPPHAGEPVVPFTFKYLDILTGTGAPALARQCYYAHYTGWLAADGFKFQSSHDTNARGEPNTPFAFAQGFRQAITGWEVGFQGMKVGGKRRLFIPHQLAYGDVGQASGHIPPKADLIFDVELMAVTDTVATADSGKVARNRAGALPRTPWCLKWVDLPAAAKQ